VCARFAPTPTLGTRAQLGVHHFALPGVIAVAGFREAAVVHIYLKGLHRGGGVALRGFLFAESAERAWQARPGTYGAVATPCARQEGLLLDAPTSVCATGVGRRVPLPAPRPRLDMAGPVPAVRPALAAMQRPPCCPPPCTLQAPGTAG